MRSFLSRCAAASVYFGAIPRAGQRVIRHLSDSNVTVRLFFLSQMWIGREPVAIFRNQNNRIVKVRGRPIRAIVQNRAKAHAKRSSRPEQFNTRFRIGPEGKIQRPAIRQADPGGSESRADSERLARQSCREATLGMDCGTGEAAYKE